MHPRIVAFGLAGALAFAGEAAAGWIVDQAVKAAGDGGRQQIVVQANRMKTVTLGPDGQPMFAVVLDLNADSITHIDFQGRRYATASIQEYTQALQAASRAAMAQMAEARKQMEQALRNMPPEQRKQAEQQMRAQMGPGGPGSPECVEPRREVRKSGQRATIAGFPAERWEVLADGQPESEVWVAPGLPVTREMDARKLEQFSAAMASAGGCGGSPAGGADAVWTLVGQGYPVRTVAAGGGPTVEVVRAESRAIPPGEFAPPAGFARQPLAQFMGPSPPR
jgi:hypothetical protein